MANIRYSSSFTSLNGYTYLVEFYDINVNLPTPRAFNIAENGLEIKYDTKKQTKFNTIVSSTCKIAFVVKDEFDAIFIRQMRNTYEEKDVYVSVYRHHTSQYSPLWSGYLLMDLAEMEDVSYPYVINLTAVDGLGLLKDVDFVPDTTEPSPYALTDTWIPTGYSRVTKWLSRCLAETGQDDGTVTGHAYKFTTSVNWYNRLHSAWGVSQANDPLYGTQNKANAWYEVKDDDPFSSITYKPKTVYEVLESICKVWGMRCIYWKHQFRFIQLGEYIEDGSGTALAPVNIPTRAYDLTGTPTGNSAYLGTTWWTRYDLEVENPNVMNGLQRLSGAKYKNFPRVKTVSADYKSIANINYFQEFPLLPDCSTWNSNTNAYMSAPIGTFTDASNLDGWHMEVSVLFQNDTTQIIRFRTNWTLRAKPSSLTWTYAYNANFKTLKWDWGQGGMYWAGAWQPPTSSPYLFIVPGQVPIYASTFEVPPGSSQVDLLQFSGPNQAAGMINVPSDVAFVGDWDFEFVALSNGGNNIYGHGSTSLMPPNGQSGLSPCSLSGWFGFPGNIDYANLPPNDPANKFQPVYGGNISSAEFTTDYTTPTNNSEILKIKGLLFGDAPTTDVPSSLLCYNGSSWVFTSFVGEWAKGSAAGTDSITELLCREVLNCQAVDTFKLIATTAQSQINKNDSAGRPKYVNPIGRLLDKDGTPYVFQGGTFQLLKDEWKGNWWQMRYVVSAGTATTTGTGGVGTIDDAA